MSEYFPKSQYNDIEKFSTDYFTSLSEAFLSINTNNIKKACSALEDAISQNNTIFTCGNGGSASISDHFVCDHMKGIRKSTNLFPRIYSLSSNLSVISAISNDITYDDIFLFQLQSLSSQNDVLITISSSGDSENIIKAIKWAKINKLRTISFTGFDGGRSLKIADINIHINSYNYGIIEDCHQSIMHILSQFIRQKNMMQEIVKQEVF